jgi:hypothetical protein
MLLTLLQERTSENAALTAAAADDWANIAALESEVPPALGFRAQRLGVEVYDTGSRIRGLEVRTFSIPL